MKAKLRTTVASVAVFAMTAGAQAGDMTHYSRQGWWNIRVKMLSDGSGVCHAAANYSGTYIAMMSGYVDGERRWSIMIGNPAWKWVKQDVEYAMTLDTPGRPYGVKFKGDVSNGDRFLFSFVDKDVINALAMDHPGRSFVVRQGPKVFGLYRLDDSAAAIRDVVNCVKAHQPSKTASVPSASSAPKSFGTGFFVADNYVLTNYHVVKSCSKVLVKYPSFMAEPAYDVGSDEVNDLILLKTKLPNRGVAAFRFQPKLGEPVASYGFPLGQLLAPEGNFTLGNITGTTGVGGDTRHFQCQHLFSQVIAAAQCWT